MQKAAICSSGTLPARVRKHERVDLVGVELVAVPLALDELSGSEHRQGSRKGWPATRRDGALPPSQRFAVAPTSPNSPSWIRPAALRPST